MPHHVVQRGHGLGPLFIDDVDRQCYVRALRDAAQAHRVRVHAYALLDDRVAWLATPADASGLALTVQAIGQRFVAAFNRRHRLRGTRWGGRFECAVVDEVTFGLAVTLHLARAAPQPWSSAGHGLGVARQPWISDLPAYWALGNTPFEREARFASLLAEPDDGAWVARLAMATRRGVPVGPAAFVERLAAAANRSAVPKPRGRPRHAPLPNNVSPIK
jgi:putative transposase